ncbi:MAG: hypothetical protein ACERKD_16785 [Prolixibacteraceae bacterium]
MRKTQTNYYSMCLALTHFYEKYKDQYESDLVIVRLFVELFGYFEQMKHAVQIQNGHTSESTKQKQIENEYKAARVIIDISGNKPANNTDQPPPEN